MQGEIDYDRLRTELGDYLDHFAFETGLGGLHVEAQNVKECPAELLPDLAAKYDFDVDHYRKDEDYTTRDDGPESYFGFRRR